jgi:hypothetical protein
VRLRHPSLGWPPRERKNSGARARGRGRFVLSRVGTEGAVRQTKGPREAGRLLGTGVRAHTLHGIQAPCRRSRERRGRNRFQESVEIARKDLLQAMETLLAAFPWVVVVRPQARSAGKAVQQHRDCASGSPLVRSRTGCEHPAAVLSRSIGTICRKGGASCSSRTF